MIENYLRARNIRYLRDSDGDFCVNFGPQGEIRHTIRVWLLAGGTGQQVYVIRGHAEKRYPRSRWADCLLMCNTWNRDRRWPKAYLDNSDPNSDGEIVLEEQIYVEKGIHQELLDDFSDTVISAIFSFWKWEKEQ
jgi:hypothetical protein